MNIWNFVYLTLLSPSEKIQFSISGDASLWLQLHGWIGISINLQLYRYNRLVWEYANHASGPIKIFPGIL